MNMSENGWSPEVEVRSRRGMVPVAVGLIAALVCGGAALGQVPTRIEDLSEEEANRPASEWTLQQIREKGWTPYPCYFEKEVQGGVAAIEGRRWANNDSAVPALGSCVTYSFMPVGAALEAGEGLSTWPLPPAGSAAAVTAATATWAGVADLHFTLRPDGAGAWNAGPPAGTVGNIRIGAGTLPAGVLAHGYYPPVNGVSAAGDVHFNNAFVWSTAAAPPVGAFDIETVALHELGHALGLDHNCTRAADVMFPAYTVVKRVPNAVGAACAGASVPAVCGGFCPGDVFYMTGIYGGAGHAANCTGACCSTPQACANLSQTACAALGWNFRGAGTICPTQNTQTAQHQGQTVVHWADASINCFNIVTDLGLSAADGKRTDLRSIGVGDNATRTVEPAPVIPLNHLALEAFAEIPAEVRNRGCRVLQDEGIGETAGPGSAVYYNFFDVPQIFIAPGINIPMADDMLLAGTARELVSLDHVCVYAPSGANYNVTMELWTDNGAGTSPLAPVPGTSCTIVGLPPGTIWDAAGSAPCVFGGTPITLPARVWLMLTFSTAEAGWVVADQAETGFTEDHYWQSGNLFFFGGNPYAGYCGRISADEQPAINTCDAWVTSEDPEKPTCSLFGAGPTPPIPPDFFNPGSQPFIGQICYSGEPLGQTPYGFFEQADTLICRPDGDPFDRCSLPEPVGVNIPIEIVALSLVGIDPIVVQYPPPTPPELWTVRVGLSDLPSPTGSMNVRKTHCNGGTWDSTLPVQAKFTFTQVQPPTGEVRVLDTGLVDVLSVSPTDELPWVSDLDPEMILEAELTTFHPGVAEDPLHQTTDCDCNNNLRRDACDIEQGISQDCNGNGIPDECDISLGTSQDTNGNGVPDECELCPDTPGVLGLCAAPPAANDIIWDSDPLSSDRTTRSLRFTVSGPGSAKLEAIRVTTVDLQHPNPKNRPQFPPPNFTAFDTRINGVCAGATTGPNFNGHHCDTDTDCLGGNTNPLITTDDGTCGSLLACSAAGETNGCARWVGPVATFREKQDVVLLGTYLGARLQCTPYYADWKAVGMITVFGAEILPSSTYEGQTYGSDCMGVESTCTNVSAPVTMLTRRSGDIVQAWNPPGVTDQPDGADVAAMVNKFKGLAGSPSNATALIQPNAIDPNTDVSSSDIVTVVDAFKGLAYPFSGPCICPSTVTCGALPCLTTGNCGAGVCVKTCVGGTNDGLPCNDNTHDHCPGGGVCPASGFCRDRCARCN